MLNLQGRNILITGASSGIGRATAVLASKVGARIIACGRDSSRLDDTLSLCCDRQIHKKIIFDIRNFSIYEDVFDEAVNLVGKLDGFVHSAGVSSPTPLRALSLDSIQEVMDINLISFMLMSNLYVKRRYSNGGSIVAISAMSAHYPTKAMGAYSASKLALEGLVKTFALEVGRKDLRINCVVPGSVDTPMTQKYKKNDFEKKQLMGILSPESIAKTIIFLLSDMSEAITGRSIYTDGGLFG